MTHEWASIDGETPIDPSHLKDRTITTRAELNQAEAQNILRAHLKYLSAKPSRRSAKFDLRWLRTLHKEMYCDVWKWAGQLRLVNLNIGVPFYHIEQSLFELTNDLAYWAEGTDQVEAAVRLHYHAVRIHPFHNGNGRWARMLANIWLRMHDQVIVRWPDQLGHTSEIRSEYLAALRDADAGNFESLIDLHARFRHS